MVQVIHVVALAAVQVLAVVLPADDTQHILLDPQETSAKDVYRVKDE